jgi:hypothetical protein
VNTKSTIGINIKKVFIGILLVIDFLIFIYFLLFATKYQQKVLTENIQSFFYHEKVLNHCAVSGKTTPPGKINLCEPEPCGQAKTFLGIFKWNVYFENVNKDNCTEQNLLFSP